MSKIRVLFTVYTTKLVIFGLKLLRRGGTNLPGKVAIKMCPDILSKVSKGYTTIFVTGTNGKTTTTKMLVSMLIENGQRVITNEAGANMKTGIITCFIDNYKNRNKNAYAVIEIDEANLKHVSKEIDINYLLITNIFRDQLDRYGEVYTTLNMILDGINSTETVLLLNGDEPLFGNIKKENKKIFFGLDIKNNNKVDVNVEGKFCINCGSPYEYNFVSYSHLGDYYCEGCGYKRPSLDYVVKDIVQNSDGTTEFVYNENKIKLNMSGLYNVYNAIAGICVTETLGLDVNKSIVSLSKEKSPFGRQEEIMIEGKKLKLMLVKNPAGYNEALNTLMTLDKKVCVCFMLNDRAADGKDVSWIFDVGFEKVAEVIKSAYCGGERAFDMAIRVNISGVEKENIKTFPSYQQFLDLVSNCEDDTIYTFVTYTCMLDFRKFLFDRKYISKLY